MSDINASPSFIDKVRKAFGLDIREDSPLVTLCKKSYRRIPKIAYTNKRKTAGLSYSVYLNEMITPDAWTIQKQKNLLVLKGSSRDRIRNVGNRVAQILTWTDDKNLDTSGDYYLYPAETLTLLKGDCEDHAFVVASFFPEDFGVAYGFYDDGVKRYGHAFNVFEDNGALWIADTVGGDCVMKQYSKDIPWKIHYILTKEHTFEVKRGVDFGTIAGWD